MRTLKEFSRTEQLPVFQKFMFHFTDPARDDQSGVDLCLDAQRYGIGYLFDFS
jgi:hypothetical protein